MSFVHRDVELSHLHPQVRTQTGHGNQMREVSRSPVSAFVCSYADRSQEPEGAPVDKVKVRLQCCSQRPERLRNLEKIGTV